MVYICFDCFFGLWSVGYFSRGVVDFSCENEFMLFVGYSEFNVFFIVFVVFGCV